MDAATPTAASGGARSDAPSSDLTQRLELRLKEMQQKYNQTMNFWAEADNQKRRERFAAARTAARQEPDFYQRGTGPSRFANARAVSSAATDSPDHGNDVKEEAGKALWKVAGSIAGEEASVVAAMRPGRRGAPVGRPSPSGASGASGVSGASGTRPRRGLAGLGNSLAAPAEEIISVTEVDKVSASGELESTTITVAVEEEVLGTGPGCVIVKEVVVEVDELRAADPYGTPSYVTSTTTCYAAAPGVPTLDDVNTNNTYAVFSSPPASSAEEYPKKAVSSLPPEGAEPWRACLERPHCREEDITARVAEEVIQFDGAGRRDRLVERSVLPPVVTGLGPKAAAMPLVPVARSGRFDTFPCDERAATQTATQMLPTFSRPNEDIDNFNAWNSALQSGLLAARDEVKGSGPEMQLSRIIREDELLAELGDLEAFISRMRCNVQLVAAACGTTYHLEDLNCVELAKRMLACPDAGHGMVQSSSKDCLAAESSSLTENIHPTNSQDEDAETRMWKAFHDHVACNVGVVKGALAGKDEMSTKGFSFESTGREDLLKNIIELEAFILTMRCNVQLVAAACGSNYHVEDIDCHAAAMRMQQASQELVNSKSQERLSPSEQATADEHMAEDEVKEDNIWTDFHDHVAANVEVVKAALAGQDFVSTTGLVVGALARPKSGDPQEDKVAKAIGALVSATKASKALEEREFAIASTSAATSYSRRQERSERRGETLVTPREVSEARQNRQSSVTPLRAVLGLLFFAMVVFVIIAVSRPTGETNTGVLPVIHKTRAPLEPRGPSLADKRLRIQSEAGQEIAVARSQANFEKMREAAEYEAREAEVKADIAMAHLEVEEGQKAASRKTERQAAKEHEASTERWQAERKATDEQMRNQVRSIKDLYRTRMEALPSPQPSPMQMNELFAQGIPAVLPGCLAVLSVTFTLVLSALLSIHSLRSWRATDRPSGPPRSALADLQNGGSSLSALSAPLLRK